MSTALSTRRPLETGRDHEEDLPHMVCKANCRRRSSLSTGRVERESSTQAFQTSHPYNWFAAHSANRPRLLCFLMHRFRKTTRLSVLPPSANFLQVRQTDSMQSV